MVTFINLPKRGPSKSEQFSQAVSRAAVGTANHLYEKEQEKKKLDFENKERENISKFLESEYDVKDTKNLPKNFQMEILKSSQKNKNDLLENGTPEEKALINDIVNRALIGQATPEEEASLPYKVQLDIQKNRNDKKEPTEFELKQQKENYNVISKQFGQEFADVWKVSPVGGQTALLQAAIDTKLRGGKIEDLLKNVNSPEGSEEFDMSSVPQMENGKLLKNFKYPDYNKRPEGYTPKEWADERRARKKDNSEIFRANKTRLDNNKRDQLEVKKLKTLSPHLPEGVSRVLIDPETGDMRPSAQIAGLVNKETQEYSKIFSRFQNRAKDTFGSRVTNFDLQSYMKQFPGLLNTQEGREGIFSLMRINLELDNLYDNALDQVYKKYGLDGIPEEKADELARAMISDRTEQLENEYLGAEQKNVKIDSGGKLSGKMVDVIGPDGQEYEVDEYEIEQLPEGFRVR